MKILKHTNYYNRLFYTSDFHNCHHLCALIYSILYLLLGSTVRIFFIRSLPSDEIYLGIWKSAVSIFLYST